MMGVFLGEEEDWSLRFGVRVVVVGRFLLVRLVGALLLPAFGILFVR